VAPFISRIVTWLRGKPGDSFLYRFWSSHRVEKLVEKHGVDKATEITRLTMAMCGDQVKTEALLPAPRAPLDDVIRPPIVVLATTTDWSNAPTTELPVFRDDPPRRLPPAA